MRWRKGSDKNDSSKEKILAQHQQNNIQSNQSQQLDQQLSSSSSVAASASASMDTSTSTTAAAATSTITSMTNPAEMLGDGSTRQQHLSSISSESTSASASGSASTTSSLISPSAIQGGRNNSGSGCDNRSTNADATTNQLSQSGASISASTSSTSNTASTSTSTTASTSASTSASAASPDEEASPPTTMLNEELDDPGQDHAVPDDLTDDPNANIVWSPQNQQSTCEFTHTITNYSQKRESGCKKAEYSNTTIDSSGNRWRLIVYVNGNGRASNHHLSLFLQVADADDLPFGWKKAVSYVLTLEHPNGQSLGYAKRNPDKTFKLCPKAIDWGWSQFITSDRIQQDGYISQDSLTVRASVTVKSSSIAIDPEDAELYLKCAVEEGNAEAVEACLAQGASVNCQFKDDLYTPLHTACSSSASNGSLDVLNLLLKRGADGNACNKWRETPLLIAANNGHKAAVEALLKNGADPSMCSEAGWSALTFAAHKGYDEIVSLLLNAGAPVNCRVIEDLSTPLHKACAGGKEGHLSAVTQLLTGGADVHALNKWRETPLLTAANHGQASAVEALLDANADARRCTDTGWSPLSIAAYKGHDDVVELLLEQGAPTEEADPTLSALLQAATKGLPNTVELLLRHGADHTVTTKKGDTALSILVEQNLIDAAVEMVTEYKASVPRCSRDRKKIQRARLLINLRMKQLKEEGEYWKDNDDSDQDDSHDVARSAQHDSENSPKKVASNGSKKKKKKGKKSMNVEEKKAKEAADALLLQLDQEDAQAEKEQAAATSKRNKKKKKKERERQVRLQQETIRREEAKKEAQELENQRRIKEEKERKLRVAKLNEQKQFEMKEAAKRQKKAAAAKQKEKEEKEKKRVQQEMEKRERDIILEQEKRDVEKKEKLRREKEHQDAADLRAKEQALQQKQAPQNSALKPKRGWEKANATDVSISADSTLPAQTTNNIENGTIEDQLATMANGVVDYLGFGSGMSTSTLGSTEVSNETIDHATPAVIDHANPVTPLQHVEPAPVSLFREEKALELLQRASVSIDSNVVKAVIYKWIVRASCDSNDFLDPLIPSWTDKNYLVSFLQRQLISESRKASNGIANNIEMMKASGSFLAELCLSLSKEVVEFSEKTGQDHSDSSLKMRAVDNGSTMMAIELDGRSKVCVPRENYQPLIDCYNGAPSLLLSSIFALAKRYETVKQILSGTELDCHLSPSTLFALASELRVEIELWTNPFSVFGENKFCGMFPDVDATFGGLPPFTEQNNDLEALFLQNGGSATVLTTFDSTTASFLIKRMLDIIEAAGNNNVPVSFITFLPMQSFRDLSTSPTLEDLSLLDARLLQSHRRYIRHYESLHPSQHTFIHGSIGGEVKPCSTGSLMLILQNDSGSAQFPFNDKSIASIMRSLSGNQTITGNHGFQSFVPNSSPSSRANSIPNSPIARQQTTSTFDRSKNGSRRGFELEPDDYDPNTEQIVSDLLEKLDISMFDQSQEFDPEAFSLSGIGNPNVVNSNREHGRFG